MRKIVFCLAFLFLIESVYGDVVLTEVMYNPTQASDTDLEWIEIYNNGTESTNLSLWKIDDNNFEDFTILPKEFIIIARELIDGTDTDNDSFESVYGNNDGVWNNLDGNYRAFDGDFSLTDTDKVNLSNGVYFEVLEYNTSFGGNGNGYTLERVDVNKENSFDNWMQSKVLGGTPGYGNIQKEGTKNIEVLVEVTGALPLLSLMNISDDLEESGIQVRPNVNNNKSIFIQLLVNSSSGINDIREVKAELNGNKFNFVKEADIDNVSAVYSGTASMNYYEEPKIYLINLSASNRFNKTNSILAEFEYLSLLAVSVDKNSINFGKIEPGKTSDTEKINVLNHGNVGVDLELYSQDLENGQNKINVSSLEVNSNESWKSLEYRPSLFSFDLLNGLGNSKDLMFRLNLNSDIIPNVYAGRISVVGIAK